MRIGIDCHTVGSGIGGNESYIFHLVRALASLDRRNEYRLYVTNRSPEVHALAAGPNVTLVKIAPHNPWIRIPLSLPLELALHPVDVLHVQYISPPLGRTPVVNMVHDLSPIHLPEFYRRREAWRQRLLLPRSIRRATRVLTVSEYCQADIARTYHLAPERVVVTYPGVSDHFRPVNGAGVRAVLDRYEIAGPYLLYVGNIQPRKNLRTLLDAFALLKRTHGLPHRLVVVGRKAWLHDAVFARVREMGLGGEVTFTSYVPYADLPALYSGAAVLVYPSLFEGFGLPPLEAMRCGTAVVVSNRPSFPEILGDAAMLVDPTAPQDIARAILAVVQDDGLRRTLVARGLERAGRYRWEDTASRTLAVYEEMTTSRLRAG